MLALLLLGLAFAAARWGRADMAALALAAVAGTTLPDIDQWLPLGGHRSALAHSVLAALLCRGPALRAVAAGLALGLALHLAADLFPRSMRGFATVKLIGVGSLGRDGSRAWLAANMAAGFALAAHGAAGLVPDRAARLALAALAGLAAILYLARVDGGWWALAMLAGAGALGWRWRRGRA